MLLMAVLALMAMQMALRAAEGSQNSARTNRRMLCLFAAVCAICYQQMMHRRWQGLCFWNSVRNWHEGRAQLSHRREAEGQAGQIATIRQKRDDDDDPLQDASQGEQCHRRSRQGSLQHHAGYWH
jgi:hypothetical protein